MSHINLCLRYAGDHGVVTWGGFREPVGRNGREGTEDKGVEEHGSLQNMSTTTVYCRIRQLRSSQKKKKKTDKILS